MVEQTVRAWWTEEKASDILRSGRWPVARFETFVHYADDVQDMRCRHCGEPFKPKPLDTPWTGQEAAGRTTASRGTDARVQAAATGGTASRTRRARRRVQGESPTGNARGTGAHRSQASRVAATTRLAPRRRSLPNLPADARDSIPRPAPQDARPRVPLVASIGGCQQMGVGAARAVHRISSPTHG
jgi:hypothetical protein